MLSYQSWIKADDIRDFQIEDMSIEDSMLGYMNEDLIIYEINNKVYIKILTNIIFFKFFF